MTTRELSHSKISLLQGITQFSKLESLQKWANEVLQGYLAKVRRAKIQKFKIKNKKSPAISIFNFEI